jgi:hypothetical protein
VQPLPSRVPKPTSPPAYANAGSERSISIANAPGAHTRRISPPARRPATNAARHPPSPGAGLSRPPTIPLAPR